MPRRKIKNDFGTFFSSCYIAALLAPPPKLSQSHVRLILVFRSGGVRWDTDDGNDDSSYEINLVCFFLSCP